MDERQVDGVDPIFQVLEVIALPGLAPRVE
jgi:hypothetical protein